MALAYTVLAAWLVFYRLRSRALVQRARQLERRKLQAARAAQTGPGGAA